MGATLVLSGVLLLMMSFIWIVGEVLKVDVVMGLIALITFPIFSIYWTFMKDYEKCKTPFFIGLSGFVLALIGKGIGL